MKRVLKVINAVAVAFSFWWFVAHALKGRVDWEFWFALSYLLLSALNLAYFARGDRTTRAN